MGPTSPYSDSTDSTSSPVSSPSPSLSTPPSSPTTPSSHPRKRKAKTPRSTIPRPPNAFILFRSDFWAREKQKPNPVENNHRDISRIAGHCWRNLDAISKQYYQDRALQLRELHRQQYPDYKFKPAPKKARLEKKESPPEQNSRCANLASTLMPELLSRTSNWVQDGTALHAVAYEPLEATFMPPVSLNPHILDKPGADLKSKPTVDPLWDDPFGLSMTIESIASSYGSSTWGLQEQFDIWGFAESSTSYMTPVPGEDMAR
jgi:HMG (high mobility group) box